MAKQKDTSRTIGAGKKAVAVILAVFFILASNLTILSYVTQNTLSDQDSYQRISDKLDLVEFARVRLLKILIESSLGSSSSSVRVDQASLEAAAEILMPYDWVNSTLDAWLAELIAYVTEPAYPFPNLTLDMQPMIAALQSPQGGMAVMQLFGNLPVCATQQQLEGLLAGNITCMPEPQYLPMASKAVSSQLAGQVPAQITLQNLQTMGMDTSNIEVTLKTVRGAYRNLRTFFWGGLLASLLFFLLYVMLFITTPNSLLKAFPWPLYGAAALGLLLIFISGTLLGGSLNMIERLLGDGMGEFSFLISTALQTLYSIIRNQWLTIVLLVAGLAVVLHILMSIVRALIKKNGNGADVSDTQPQRIRKSFRY